MKKIDLLELRKEKGITREHISKVTGLNITTLWRYETERMVPTVDNLVKYLNVIGYDLELVSKVVK